MISNIITVTSQIVQVVSTELVPIMLGSVSFQSNEVSGAQYSAHTITIEIDNYNQKNTGMTIIVE